MKILNTAPISNTSRFPVKKGTLQFLQDAHKEVTAALIKSLIGPAYNPSAVYVMSGVINSSTLPTYTISAGAVFYNGEVYDFDATSFTASGANVGVYSIGQAQYTTDADPVTFTDLTVRNVHNIRKIQLTQGASGSGLADYSQSFFLSFQIPAKVNITAPVIAPYNGNQVQIIGTYPNFIFYVPPASNLHPCLAAGSVNIGDALLGGSDFTVPLGTTLLTSEYYVLGTMISNGTAETDATVDWNIRSRTTTNFILHVREQGSYAQNIAFEWMAFAK